MHPDDLGRRFADIAVWKRAPSVLPTTAPAALRPGEVQPWRGPPDSVRRRRREAARLLIEFGPSRKSYHPEYPFWRLQNDGISELENAENAQPRASNTDAKRSELLKHGVTGGLKADVYEAVRKDPHLLADFAHELLDANFPPSLHDDILAAVGLDTATRSLVGGSVILTSGSES